MGLNSAGALKGVVVLDTVSVTRRAVFCDSNLFSRGGWF